jgi:ubiquinone/menaquinone biosynthesis C-methylase UbiE
MAHTIKTHAAHVLPHIKADQKILDVGCGLGSLSCDLAKHVPEGSVIGVDKSQEDLVKAREFAKLEGITNISFLIGDAASLGFPDNEFDIDHSHQALHHAKDAVATLQEMMRVAKPGGIVAVRDRARILYWPKQDDIEEFLEISDMIVEGTGGNSNIGAKHRKFAREAGFKEEDVTIKTSTWCYANERSLKSVCGK